MIANSLPEKLAVEEYLEWEAQQLYRHEYIDGAVLP